MVEKKEVSEPYLRREMTAESVSAINSAKQTNLKESEVEGLSDDEYKRRENALKLRKLQEAQRRNDETEDQKAAQERLTNTRIACVLRWIAILGVITVFICFIGSVILVVWDLLIKHFLSNDAHSYLSSFVALGFGMAATRIFDKWFPK